MPWYPLCMQAGYQQLHADILAGRAPQRYVVVGGISGIADGLVGAMTAFLHALLTDRAFLMRMEFTEVSTRLPSG